MNADTTTCRRCGNPIPLGALGGNCPRCLVSLAISTSADGASSSNSPLNKPSEPASFARFFADYEILGELARGGMGIVYRARQVSLNRPVALKMIVSGQLATPAQVQRFRLEAEAAGRLDHPNIVPIYEIGEHQGQHFYSMKLIEGGTLQVGNAECRMENEGSDVRCSSAVIAKVARAVHFAHQRGILHRDLKPTNILIDAEGEPHITDFGLAKLFDEDITLTQSTAVLGTPAYMAPEVASGQAAEAATAADIYSLGAILYELLAGKPPFTAENIPALLRKIVEEEPQRPSLLCRSRREEALIQSEIKNPKSKMEMSLLTSAPTKIDRDLEIICLKCLEKAPARRYVSATRLAEDLERWLAGEPILARPSTAAEKLWRWCKRKPTLAALWGGLGMALLAGVSGVAWEWRRAEAIERGAHQEAQRTRRTELETTDQIWRSLVEQARTERSTGDAGQRHYALEAVTRAAAIRPSLELRNEAIAALVLPDLRFVPVWTNPYPKLSAGFAPSLTRFAVASSSGRVKLFRASDAREEFAFPAVAGRAGYLRFSPDERFVVVSYSTGSNVVWEVATRTPVFSWGNGGRPGAFTTDSQRLLAPETSGLVCCVLLPDGQELWRRQTGGDGLSLKVQSQQKYFAARSSKDPKVEVRTVDSGELLRTLPHPSSVSALTWSPDGTRLLVALETGRVYVWAIDSESEPEDWKAHDDSVLALAFSPSGEWLASSASDRTVRLWSWPDHSLAVTAHGYELHAPAFSADAHTLAGVARGSVLGGFEVSTSVGFHRFPVALGERPDALSLDVSPDGKLVAAGYTDGVRLLDFATGREMAFQPVGTCASVIFTPDGLVTSGPPGLARWPIEQMMSPAQVRFGLREKIGDDLPFNYASMTADGRLVAAADYGRDRLRVYEVKNPTNRFELENHPEYQQVAISPDGRWVAGGIWNGRGVRIWDVLSRRLVKELPMGKATAIFSPDSRRLVTCSDRYQVWEVSAWQELYHTPKTAESEVVRVAAFSPDGRILATTIEGRAVQLLEAATGRVLAELEAPGAVPISCLRFTPDSASLLALELARGIQVWDLRRLRAELAALKLDWDAPPYPAEK